MIGCKKIWNNWLAGILLLRGGYIGVINCIPFTVNKFNDDDYKMINPEGEILAIKGCAAIIVPTIFMMLHIYRTVLYQS